MQTKEHIIQVFKDFIKRGECFGIEQNSNYYTNNFEIFEKITFKLLNVPIPTENTNHNKTVNHHAMGLSSSINFTPQSTYNLIINRYSEISVDSIFLKIIMSENIKFNFPEFNNIISEAILTRKDLKKQIYNMLQQPNYSKQELELTEKVQIMIKDYLNFIFGYLTSKKEKKLKVINVSNLKHYIFKHMTDIMLELISKLIKNGITIYSINTDLLRTSYIELDEVLKKFDDVFDTIYQKYNITITPKDISCFTFDTGIVHMGHKNHIVNIEESQIKGVMRVNESRVKSEVKKFLTGNYGYFFPEYVF